MTEPTQSDDPIRLVADLFERARTSEPADATRFVLATVDPDWPFWSFAAVHLAS